MKRAVKKEKRADKEAAIARSPASPVGKRLAIELIDRLINEVANRALANSAVHPAKQILPEIIDASVADEANIMMGREDLQSFQDLRVIFEGIKDDQERETAYMALYRVVWGTFNIAKSGVYPLDEMRHGHALQAAASRAGKDRKFVARNKVIWSVIEGFAKRGKLPPKSRLLGQVNVQLKIAGEKEISLPTLHRLLGQQCRSK